MNHWKLSSETMLGGGCCTAQIGGAQRRKSHLASFRAEEDDAPAVLPGGSAKNACSCDPFPLRQGVGEGPRIALAREACAYLDAHCMEKFSLKKLAGALFVNECYLARAFKYVTGHTLLQYHSAMRCKIACRLLEENTLSVSQIGIRLGFSSASHFSQVFKRVVKVTPAEYRESLKK